MAMDNQERLSADLLFEVDGHVTEIVLACLADGELGLVSEAAAAHVDGCDTCTARLGAAALRSIGADEALQEMGAIKVMTELSATEAGPVALPPPAAAPSQDVTLPGSSRRARRPFPALAIAAALVVAVVAGMPGFLDAAATLPTLLRSVPVLVRVVIGILRGTPAGLLTVALLLKWVSAVILIIAGFVVARTMTQKRSLQGGMG
jgi:hypothetical protein